MNHVLFVCTGNYYRSRFAEAVFNHRAIGRGLPWRAFSRGLAIHAVWGDLSIYSRLALERRGIARCHTGPTRQQLTHADLQLAYRVIALDRQEHYPMMAQHFPDWADRIEYWLVHDLALTSPEDALAAIENQVEQLLDWIASPELQAI